MLFDEESPFQERQSENFVGFLTRHFVFGVHAHRIPPRFSHGIIHTFCRVVLYHRSIRRYFLLHFDSVRFAKKMLSEVLHFNVTLMLILIFIATVAIRLELEGAFWMLHLFGPLLVLLRFFLFCDCTKIKTPCRVFTSIAFPIGYILFSFCLRQATGEYPFPAKLILMQPGPLIAVAVSAGLCVLILLLAFGLLYVNRFLRKKFS